MRKIIFFILSLFLLHHCAISQENATARIIKAKGNVNLKTSQQQQFFQAFAGQSAHIGDQIQTLDNSAALIEFRIGGLAGVTPNSVVEIVGDRSVNKVSGSYQLKSGGVWVNVKKRQDSTFNIQTKSGMLGVRGTEFILVVLPDQSIDLAVIEGTIDWTPASQEEPIQISQGHRVQVEAQSGIPKNIQPLDSELCALEMRKAYFRNLTDSDLESIESFDGSEGELDGFSDDSPVAQAQSQAQSSKSGSYNAGSRTTLSRSSSIGVSSSRSRHTSGLRSNTRLRTTAQQAGSRPASNVTGTMLTSGYAGDPENVPSNAQGSLTNTIGIPSPYQPGIHRARTNRRHTAGQPKGMQASSSSPSQASFDWEEDQNADNYVLLISDDESFSDLIWSTTVEGTNTSYPDSAPPLEPGTYQVQVSTVRGGSVVGNPQRTTLIIK